MVLNNDLSDNSENLNTKQNTLENLNKSTLISE